MIKQIRTQLDEILHNIYHNPIQSYEVWIHQLKKLIRTCEITIVLLIVLLIAETTLLVLGFISFSVISIIIIAALALQIRKFWRLGNLIGCHYEFIKFLFGENNNQKPIN
jgi:hypothetical protein